MKQVHTIKECTVLGVVVAMYTQKVNDYMSRTGESLEKSIRYELGSVTSPINDEYFKFDLESYEMGSEFLQKYNLEYLLSSCSDCVPVFKDGKRVYVLPVKKETT